MRRLYVSPNIDSNIADRAEPDTAASDESPHSLRQTPSKIPYTLRIAKEERIIANKPSNYAAPAHAGRTTIRHEARPAD